MYPTSNSDHGGDAQPSEHPSEENYYAGTQAGDSMTTSFLHHPAHAFEDAAMTFRSSDATLANTNTIFPALSVPADLPDDTHERDPNISWWNYQRHVGTADDPSQVKLYLSTLGAGSLRYVTLDIDASNVHNTLVNGATSPGDTVVWRQYRSGIPLPLPGVYMEIRGRSWVSRRGAGEGRGFGRTLLQAAQVEARHINHLVRQRSLQSSTLGDSRPSKTRIDGLRNDTGSQSEYIGDLIDRVELPPGSRTFPPHRYIYQGDIFKNGQFLYTRHWGVELVISNYDQNRVSAFTPEKLEDILIRATSSDLSSDRIDLHSDATGEKSTVSRSWYIATDGGETSIEDQSALDFLSLPFGETRSAKPVLTLVMTVLPTHDEYNRGLLAPAEF